MSIIIEKEQILNFYSPTEGLIQIAGTGSISIYSLFSPDGAKRIEGAIYTLPEDAREITWNEFAERFELWRTTFRHTDEDFSALYQLIIKKTAIKKKDVPPNEECGKSGRFTDCRQPLKWL